jgi:putative DNA primase/helicase
VRINPKLFADHIRGKNSPIIAEGVDDGDGCFYRYRNSGVWQIYPKGKLRKQMLGELNENATDKRINESMSLLFTSCYEPQEHITPDLYWLNLKNGMFNVNTMELRPHAPEYYSRVQLPVSYDKDTRCDEWRRSLRQMFADDEDKEYVLQQFFGYCLFPKLPFPAVLFQIGGGGNGKGVVEKVLCALLGKENVAHISLARLEKPFGAVEIRNKLLNTSSETESTSIETTMFKRVATGDPIQADVKYKGDIKFEPFAKHLFSMNDFPRLKEKGAAIQRRIIILEYRQRFTGERDRKNLADELIEKELDGIFLWAAAGLRDVLEREMIWVPNSVNVAMRRFRVHTDTVLLFEDECCLRGGQEKPPVMYGAYKSWCEESNIKRVLGKQAFYERLIANSQDSTGKETITRIRAGTIEVFDGISLRQSPPPF